MNKERMTHLETAEPPLYNVNPFVNLPRMNARRLGAKSTRYERLDVSVPVSLDDSVPIRFFDMYKIYSSKVFYLFIQGLFLLCNQ